MPPRRSPRQQINNESFEAMLRRELMIHFLLILVLTVLIVPLIVPLIDKFADEPGQAVWITIPALTLVLIIILAIVKRQQFKLGFLFLAFFTGYLMVFWLAAETRLLDWTGSLVGYQKEAPHNFLALNRFGDWHYDFAADEPATQDLAIVTMKRPATLEEGRYDIARLIRLAAACDAKGIAFDFYFNDNATQKSLDDLLCTEVTNAKSRNIPVFVAYDYQVVQNTISRVGVAASLESCLPFPSNQGHMIGYAERDGKIRMVPLYFRGNPSLESLSLKIARYLNPGIRVPDNWLLQFTKPEDDFPIVSYDTLIEKTAAREVLRDRFVLVGEESSEDSFETAYGLRPGIVIHAFVVHSLRSARFIKRTSWRSSFLMIAVSCFLIMYLVSRAMRNIFLVVVTGTLSFLFFLLSALAMRLSLTWIDVIYPLAAVWLFLLIMIGLRRVSGVETPRLSFKNLKQVVGRAKQQTGRATATGAKGKTKRGRR